ncbi:hypothetical protein ONZ45_g8428 [Pleurotus djamor]|nr:hypothetical protein ONZ45_g8428 [Pleurotus djamor]
MSTSTSNVSPLLTENVVPTLERLQVSKFFAALGNHVLFYDYFLTFGDEVRYIWRERWSSGKIMFMMTRYPVMVEAILTYWNQLWPSVTIETCTTLFNITGWMFIIEVVTAETVMTLRVWALWGRSRRIAFLLGAAALICCVVTAVVFVKFHTSQHFLSLGNDADGVMIAPLPGCYPIGGSNIIVIGYVALLVYETWVIYFVTQAAISLVNVMIFLTQPREYENLLTP